MITMVQSNSESGKYGFAKFFADVIESLGGTALIDNVQTSNIADLTINIFGISKKFFKLQYHESGNVTSPNNYRVYYDKDKSFIWGFIDVNNHVYGDATTMEAIRYLITKWNGKVEAPNEFLNNGNPHINLYNEPFLAMPNDTATTFSVSGTVLKEYSNIFKNTSANPKLYPENVYVMPFMFGCAIADDLYVTNGMLLNPGMILTNEQGTYKALTRRILYKIS